MSFTSTSRTPAPSPAAPTSGATGSWTWNNANPLTRIYAPGVSPLGASGLTACQLVGTLACLGTVLLNYVD
ncbi:MAG TPA: hypothetical protein PKU97_20365 [Kofleriaceae bacterium]|nr:hypothetical protein [Kofleriaceae bacterium]